MLQEARRYLEAGLASLSPARATEMARSLVQGGGTEQVGRITQDLLEWSRRGRERITELVQSEVKRQLRALGVATRDDLDALRRRVRELESASGGSRRGGRGTGAKHSTAKRSTSKKSTAKRSTAKRSTTKRSTVKSSPKSSSS